MTCDACKDIVESPEAPHVLRSCEKCGRTLRVRQPGPHGIGVTIKNGQQFVIPKGFMTVSLNPLKSRAHLTRYGLRWFAEQVHLEGLPTKKDDLPAEIERLDKVYDETITASPLLRGLDVTNPEHGDKIFEALKADQDSPAWWAALATTFLGVARDSIANGDIEQAVWAMACQERCRSLVVFKEHLEEVVWMGQGAKRVIDLLHTWEGNQKNADEGFWQITLTDNVYAISQVFAVPLVFIKQAAYVGGMNVNGQNAKLVDYLFAQEASRGAVLVEIKTPVTRLLGRKYRGTYTPSSELVGATMQVLDYRDALVRNISTLGRDTENPIGAFPPRCVVIAGNGARELTSEDQRKAFEMFRGNQKDVEIVTYDELFRKLEVLASLFRISRSGASGQANASNPADHGGAA